MACNTSRRASFGRPASTSLRSWTSPPMSSSIPNGLTNDQIGQACGITKHAVKKALERLFARMNVSSRAELVATLGVRAGEP